MYFQTIDIRNYGSIADFHYSFRFDDNGHPIPLVLIGENGTGKTLAITNMVDALIEIKRKVYGETLFEVNKNNFYKIGSKNYISFDQNTSRVVIALKHGEKELKYTDIMSNKPEKIAEDQFILQEDIGDKSLFEEQGFYKNVSGSLKQKEYSDFISLYFPVDRFYLPLWYNNDNYNRIDYSKKTNISQPDTNMIKVDILSNIKEWLTNVYMQTMFRIIQMPDNPAIAEKLRGKQIKESVESNIQRAIRTAMNVIIGTNDYQPRIVDRRNQMVAFTMSGISCRDISQLSEGQMSLFAIAVSIIKEWDIAHDSFELKDICVSVIIDEADLGLHINYMHDCFPRMMKLFPNVQFILTTHSPFMIAGLSEIYGDNIDILTMPEGLKITDISAFSEVQRAQEIVNAGINQIREDNKRLKNELNHLQQLQNTIVLYTEGTTDEILLKKALTKLHIDDFSVEIYAASQNRGKHGDDAIKKLLVTLQENPCVNSLVVGNF